LASSHDRPRASKPTPGEFGNSIGRSSRAISRRAA
jgi:hypothetical protein